MSKVNDGLMTPSKLREIMLGSLLDIKIEDLIQNSNSKKRIISKESISPEEIESLKQTINLQISSILEFQEQSSKIKRALSILEKKFTEDKGVRDLIKINKEIEAFLNQKIWFRYHRYSILEILQVQIIRLTDNTFNLDLLKKLILAEEKFSNTVFNNQEKKISKGSTLSLVTASMLLCLVIPIQAQASCKDTLIQAANTNNMVSIESIGEVSQNVSNYITLKNGIKVFNLKEENNRFSSLIEEYFKMFEITPEDLGVKNIVFTQRISARCSFSDSSAVHFQENGGMAVYDFETIVVKVPQKDENGKISNISLLYFIDSLVHEATHFKHSKIKSINENFNNLYNFNKDVYIISQDAEDKDYGSNSIGENIAENISIVVSEYIKIYSKTGEKINSVTRLLTSLDNQKLVKGGFEEVRKRLRVLYDNGFFPKSWVFE